MVSPWPFNFKGFLDHEYAESAHYEAMQTGGGNTEEGMLASRLYKSQLGGAWAISECDCWRFGKKNQAPQLLGDAQSRRKRSLTHERSLTRAPTRACMRALMRFDFPCSQPFKDPPPKLPRNVPPTKVSTEVPTKSNHPSGRGSPVLFLCVLFLDKPSTPQFILKFLGNFLSRTIALGFCSEVLLSDLYGKRQSPWLTHQTLREPMSCLTTCECPATKICRGSRHQCWGDWSIRLYYKLCLLGIKHLMCKSTWTTLLNPPNSSMSKKSRLCAYVSCRWGEGSGVVSNIALSCKDGPPMVADGKNLQFAGVTNRFDGGTCFVAFGMFSKRLHRKTPSDLAETQSAPVPPCLLSAWENQEFSSQKAPKHKTTPLRPL